MGINYPLQCQAKVLLISCACLRQRSRFNTLYIRMPIISACEALTTQPSAPGRLIVHVQVTKCEVTFQKFIMTVTHFFVDTYSTVGSALYTYNPSTVLVGVAFLTFQCTTTHEDVTTTYPLDLQPACLHS